MTILPLYLMHRFFVSILQFLEHWYVQGFWFFFHRTTGFLGRLDRSIALNITFRHLFEPLYQDHSVIGHILGFAFRFLRLTTGGIFYFFVIVFAGIVYILWAGFPLFVLIKIIFPLVSSSSF